MEAFRKVLQTRSKVVRLTDGPFYALPDGPRKSTGECVLSFAKLEAATDLGSTHTFMDERSGFVLVPNGLAQLIR
jgi:hypothetical protein